MTIDLRLVIGIFCALTHSISVVFGDEETTPATESVVVRHYAKLVETNYRDALKHANHLEKGVDDFLATPSAEGLKKLRTDWVAARVPYLQTEAFRFYEGPIDDENGPEGLLNAWPMDEAYLDYVKGSPEAGITNNANEYPTISRALIKSLNEKAGEENISCGYHAIEFLLWGQDFSPTGPGDRPFTDYSTEKNAKRRSAYLKESVKLLVSNLESLVDAWAPEKANYRAKFEADDPKTSLKKILTGLSMLSGFEMASERLLVAYDTQEQEDEHSCFSDTTHIDIIQNLKGIENVWNGTYGKLKGAGVEKVVSNADLRKSLSETIRKSVELAEKIPAPFDQAIQGEDTAAGRQAILKLVENLESQAELLLKLSQALGFEVPISE